MSTSTGHEEGLGAYLAGAPPRWKRTLDVAVVVAVVLLLWPLLLLIALWIKVCSPGPALFKQERIGFLGQPFMLWKFRTMSSDSEGDLHRRHLKGLIQAEEPMTKLDALGDPRLIPLAGFMRCCGLDELPQLINVWRGEMSLVGPRPCLPYEAREHQQWQKQRFDTLPGLTGLWQVSGKNRTTFEQMIRRDVSYVVKRSLWLDLKILLKTLPAIWGELSQRDYAGSLREMS